MADHIPPAEDPEAVVRFDRDGPGRASPARPPS
jgi:hypothetical protein